MQPEYPPSVVSNGRWAARLHIRAKGDRKSKPKHEMLFGRTRLLLPVPFLVWEQLALLCSRMASPPVTKAQVTLMRSDNVVAGDSLALADLGIAPTALSTVLPEYRF